MSSSSEKKECHPSYTICKIDYQVMLWGWVLILLFRVFCCNLKDKLTWGHLCLRQLFWVYIHRLNIGPSSPAVVWVSKFKLLSRKDKKALNKRPIGSIGCGVLNYSLFDHIYTCIWAINLIQCWFCFCRFYMM